MYLGGPDVGALAANSNQSFAVDVQGVVACKPGNFVGVFASSAGTAPIVTCSMIWQES